MRRLYWLFLVLPVAIALAGCGEDENDGPRRLEEVFVGKDSDGEDLDPEEMAAQGDRIWFLDSTSVGSFDGRTGKPVTSPQEVGTDRPILYDIAAGDAGVWVVATSDDKTQVFKVDESSGKPGTPIEIKLNSRYIEAGSGLEIAVGAGRVWVTL